MRHPALPLFALATGAAAEPVALFNGKDLSGWTHEGPRATFAAHAGELRTSGAGNQPNWLHTDREYENFRLRFEYKLAQWAEAAVIVRAPRLGRPMQAGLAVFLGHDFHNNTTPYVTGAVAGVLPPRSRRPTDYGAWHAVEVDLAGDRLRVAIDGSIVQDVDLAAHAELSHRLKRGFIGFPDLGHAYSLRNIVIEDRGGIQTFVELFDGRSLKGWEVRGGGTWDVHGGAIRGANGHGILYAPPAFRNFELTVLVRSRNRVNSGVFLRGSPDLQAHRGFEVQIYSPPDGVYPTGSVYAKARSRLDGDFEERWFLMQVRVEGTQCEVRVDGSRAASFDALAGADLQPGRIGLQIHMDNASVEFRDVRVRTLQ